MSENTENTKTDLPSAASSGRFTGLSEFRAAILQLLARARAERWPDLLLCDPDFSLWPLGDSEVLAALEAWSHRPNQFTIIAADYRHIEQRFPRFIRWRQQWEHIVHAHAAAPVHAASLPRCMLALPHAGLHMLDPVRCRGIHLQDANSVREMGEVLDEILLKSHTAFPASITGL